MKTHSLPIIAAFALATSHSVQAEVAFSASSIKSYRNSSTTAGGLQFTGGSFDINFRDGNFIYQTDCFRSAYWPPNVERDPCPLGSTGYLSAGNLEQAQINGAYFSVISVITAIAIEPRRPELVTLTAAPASKLQRPSNGFSDNSYSMLYNLHIENSIRENVITQFQKSTSYFENERSKMESEIVKGVYRYTFPRIRRPDTVLAINNTIFPMVEGLNRRNNKTSGFDFDGVLKRQFINPNNTDDLPGGFYELSVGKPNILSWKGLTPSDVFSGADKLFLSIRNLSNDQDPTSVADTINEEASNAPQALFPGFQTGGNPRILLASPYARSLVIPPLFESGTRGVVQLEINRDLKTSGVTYDLSRRTFEVPIVFVNRYTDYALSRGVSNFNILDDADGDRFNNLEEWLFDSDARNPGRVPKKFVAEKSELVLKTNTLATIDDSGFTITLITFEVVKPQYFGFRVPIKLQTVPANVNYILQRSFDGGKSWSNFVSDSKWNVSIKEIPSGTINESDPASKFIQVESKYNTLGGLVEPPVDGSVILAPINTQGRPPDTLNETYRVKLSL